jgi:hypothetical protein
MAYNSTIHTSIDFTPSKLMFGRELMIPLGLVLSDPNFALTSIKVLQSAEDYGDKLEDVLKSVYANTRENFHESAVTQKHPLKWSGLNCCLNNMRNKLNTWMV